MDKSCEKEGYLIFRPWITDKNGNRIYAKSKGKRAFPIWVSGPKEKALQ